VLVTYLHKDRSGICQQVSRHCQAIAQVRKVAVYAVAPGIPKSFDLLRLTCDLTSLAILHITASRRPLKIAVKSDAGRRIEIDALHLASQALALREARHDLQRVAKDHAVRPVLIVQIELSLVDPLGNPVEIRKEVRCDLVARMLALLAHAE